MAALSAFRQHAIRLPPGIGRVYTPASFGAPGLTVVVNALIGLLASGAFERQHLVRAGALTSADLDRDVSSFAGSTGTFTHNQTAYSDVTVGTETIELLQEAFPRQTLDDAVNWALQKLTREHADIVPLRYGIDRYPLRALFPWILDPSSVQSVAYRNSPVLSRNRYMQGWNGVSAANVDSYTLAGTGAVLSRISASPTPNKGEYAASVQRVGADVTLTQTVLQFHLNDWMRSRTLLLVMVGYSATASILRASISDGVGTQNTSLHSGGSTFERLTQTITVDPTAPTTLTIAGQINTTNGIGIISQLYVADATAISDALEEDAYVETPLERGRDYWFDQSDMSLRLNRNYGPPGQLVIKSYRPYLLETERLSAQTDTADAPLVHVAYGVLASALEAVAFADLSSLSPAEAALGARVRGYYQDYVQKFDKLMRQHQNEGPLPPAFRLRAPPARRI